MTCTGRLCGTSASSAPRLTVIGDLEALGEDDELRAEQLPAQRRLGPECEQHVAARGRGRPDADRRPHDRAPAVVESDVRPDGGEVGERLGVDLGHRGGAPALDQRAHGAVDAASPASFHPVNAATSVGERNSGSASHRTCSIPARYRLGRAPSGRARRRRRSAPRRRSWGPEAGYPLACADRRTPGCQQDVTSSSTSSPRASRTGCICASVVDPRPPRGRPDRRR